MKNLFLNKKTLPILLLIIASIISVIWIYFKAKDSSTTPLSTPSPVNFELTRTLPSNGVNTTVPQTSAIEFIFSKSINPNTLVVVIDPLITFKTEVSDNRRSVFVKATPYWQMNKNYTITVIVESEEGEKLPEVINYPLNIVGLKDSNLVE